MTEIVYDLDDSTVEVIDDVVEKTKRGKHAVLKDGDPYRSYHWFSRARQKNIKVLSAVAVEYGLAKTEVKRAIGHDIQKTNQSLMSLSSQMKTIHIDKQRTGKVKIDRTTLEEIEQVLLELENFRDLIRGLDEGKAMIVEDQQ